MEMNEKEIKKALERLEKQKARIKRQNDKANEKYDRVSVAFPSGTKKRIEGIGESANGYIIRLVLDDLNRREAEQE